MNDLVWQVPAGLCQVVIILRWIVPVLRGPKKVKHHD